MKTTKNPCHGEELQREFLLDQFRYNFERMLYVILMKVKINQYEDAEEKLREIKDYVPKALNKLTSVEQDNLKQKIYDSLNWFSQYEKDATQTFIDLLKQFRKETTT